MGVTPSEFKQHSDRVEQDYNDEISRRCAVSRGYYYAFHFLRENTRHHPDSDYHDNGGDHGRASDFLKKIGERSLADDLHDLRKMRNLSDYDIDDDVEAVDFAMFMNDLENFMRRAKQVI